MMFPCCWIASCLIAVFTGLLFGLLLLLEDEVVDDDVDDDDDLMAVNDCDFWTFFEL